MTALRWVRSFLLAFALFIACTAENSSPVPAVALNYSNLTREGDALGLYFDEEHLPEFRIDAVETLRPRLAFHPSGAQTPILFDATLSSDESSQTVIATARTSEQRAPEGPGTWRIDGREIHAGDHIKFHFGAPRETVRPCTEHARKMRSAKPEDSARQWLSCAQQAKQKGLLSEETRCYRAAAYYLNLAGQLEASNRALDSAQTVDAAVSHHLGIVRNDYYRSRNAFASGHLRTARDAIDRAFKKARKFGFEREAASLLNLKVRLFREDGRFAEAVAAATQALEAQQTHGAAVDVAHALNNLAWVKGQGMDHGVLAPDWNDVAEGLRQAQKRFHDAEDTLHASMAAANRAWVLWRSGDPKEARALLQASDGTLEYRRFRHRMLGELALQEQKPALALKQFGRVVALSREHSILDDELFLAHLGQARAHLLERHPAESQIELAHAMAALFRRGVQTLVQESQASYFGSRAYALEALVREAVEHKELDLAFLAQAASFAAPYRALAHMAALESVDQKEWDLRVSRYQKARHDLDEKLGEEDFVRPERAALWRETLARARRDVSRSFEALYDLLGSQGPDVQFYQTDKLRAALGPGEAVVLGSGIEGLEFLLTKSGLHTVSRPNLPAALRDADIEHVYLTGVEPERYPSFSPLTVSRIPDPALLLPRRRHSTSKLSVVVADTANDLPFARQEGQLASRHLEANAVFVGSDARRVAVVAALSDAHRFHFSGHSDLDEDDAWQSYLALADGERLSAIDVMALRAPLDLVVLSGCESGKTSVLSTRVPFGLAEAFLLAGAKTVVASQEALSDESTVEVVRQFYENGGILTPAHALTHVNSSSFVVYGRHIAGPDEESTNQ